jgi:hypothetical protein
LVWPNNVILDLDSRPSSSYGARVRIGRDGLPKRAQTVSAGAFQPGRLGGSPALFQTERFNETTGAPVNWRTRSKDDFTRENIQLI